MANVQTSFEVDDGTARAIDQLKGVFGVTSSTAVILKAIALARVAARTADGGDHTITLLDSSGEKYKIDLAG